jgi:Uncharacterised protein family (UPF0158)
MDDMRRLKVDLDEVKYAMDSAFDSISNYLDLETGEVVSVTDETRQQLEALFEMTAAETLEAIQEAIQGEQVPDWQKALLHDAALVEFGFNTRFVEIPPADSRAGYDDMEAFIETVSQQHLRELLQVAIRGKGAFRRFKDVLATYPQERERWFQFHDERLFQRALDWLETEGISPVI